MSTRHRVGALVVAAGESRRMNGVDKIMVPLANKPLLAWSVEALQESPLVDKIVIVNSQRNMESVRCLAIDSRWSKVIDVCLGGKRRQDSVAAGLAILKDCEWVIIQDGARPFLAGDIIERGLEAARETGAAVAAVPVTDTIKVAGDDNIVIETPPRRHLWAIQTPQIFRMDIINEAYKNARDDVTDDASLVENLGYKVKLYSGTYDNIKITTPRDLEVAGKLIESMKKDGQ